MKYFSDIPILLDDKMPKDEIKIEYCELIKEYILTEQEARALYDYFLQHGGYISEEFNPIVKLIIKDLEKYFG